ncbi:dispanin subfamily A member 2b-like [Scomber japonicus]|uniref:dispanin subfamily A member 2b-like n=1 Tax=Scomber japonicus TaxID=13676 RepID=UPI002305BDDC|nr:dispanin subfamily A member 2b-like [Scomber japonicus]
MNPPGYSADAFPLQGERMVGIPAQPEAATIVQYTTVNVTSDPPKDHIIWSLCCFVYFNPLCLGLAALVYSFKARDRKVARDLEGARHYGATARCLNILSTLLFVVAVLVSIIAVVVFVGKKKIIP